jgi:DNA-binding winged helix-turn-helix (wHTH) protein
MAQSVRRPIPWASAFAVPLLAGATLHGRTGLLEVVAAALLAVVVLIALLGGRWPALTCAVVSALVLNDGFTEPVGTLRVAHTVDILELAIFAITALLVSTVLDHVVRREVARAEEAEDEPSSAADVLTVGDLSIDFDRRQVSKRGQLVPLTPTEWSFLALLARNVGRLVPRDQILAEVWGPGYEKETHYLRVYVGQLRRKLEDDPAHPRHIRTTSGVGYTLER